MNLIRTPRQIGLAVRSQRKKLGLTQQELAEKAGVARSFVNRVERGTAAAVYPDKLLSLLAALNLHLAIVADGDTGSPGPFAPQPDQEIDPEREELVAITKKAALAKFKLDPALLEPAHPSRTEYAILPNTGGKS